MKFRGQSSGRVRLHRLPSIRFGVPITRLGVQVNQFVTLHAPCIQSARQQDERSIEQFERELKLTRRAGGAVDEAEAGAAHDVGRQAEINEIEDVEEFGTEL